MTTFVGDQEDFAKVLAELVELDYDAVEAYDAAINRVKNEKYKVVFKEFRSDHAKHIGELNAILVNHGQKAVSGPSMVKQWITKGRVVMANMIGDENILKAMYENEKDTNAAYGKANDHKSKWVDAEEVVSKGLSDERKHKEWLEQQI
jgi:rubrerythrin